MINKWTGMELLAPRRVCRSLSPQWGQESHVCRLVELPIAWPDFWLCVYCDVKQSGSERKRGIFEKWTSDLIKGSNKYSTKHQIYDEISRVRRNASMGSIKSVMKQFIKKYTVKLMIIRRLYIIMKKKMWDARM